MSEAVPVPPDVAEALEAVRLSGLTNMFDRPAVAYLAEQMGYDEAAAWLRAHRDEYARGIFHGFRASEPAPTDTNDEN